MKTTSIALTLLLVPASLFAEAKTKIVFVAGKASHGTGAHEHKAGSMLLSRLLNENMPNVESTVVTDGWPAENKVFDGAKAVVVYCDGGGRHVLNPQLDFFEGLHRKGVGLVCIHYGVETVAGDPGEAFLRWLGGYFEVNWSVNPHWDAEFKMLPDHPITRGVKPFKIQDEWYYHMRFRPGMENVTPILSAHPTKDTLSRPDGSHSGNPQVRKEVAEGQIQHVGWASDPGSGRGRGFGFTGGHFHKNWQDDNFRKVVLNAIVWSAGLEVPAGGLGSKTPGNEEMEANLDGKGGKKKEELKGKVSEEGASFVSPVVTNKTSGMAVDIEVNISGAKQLFLVVDNAGNGNSHDWADWIEPTLVGLAGETKLIDLKWKSASSQHGKPQINLNCEGNELVVNNEPVEFGIGTHANSIITYQLEGKYIAFRARGGLDKGGVGRSDQASVKFMVFTRPPLDLIEQMKKAKPKVSSNIDTSIKSLPVDKFILPDDLEVSVWATSPLFYNPTNIDFDYKGRAWVAEGVNYRGSGRSAQVAHKDGGDRIMVLEDTTGDGKADKSHVFVQDPDLVAPLGVAVIDNRIVVSQPPSLFVYTDVNRDDKFDPEVDKKEALLTGFGGKNHDHSLHSVTVGPDGDWYFNTGNAGQPDVTDKEGNRVIAGSPYSGREIAGKPSSDGHVYIGGLTMKVRPDGTGLRCIGFNFRNSYEQCVTSFGDVFQNDNDDPPACRTTWLMEYGNLGFASADGTRSWGADRRFGQPTQVAEWRQDDPGTIPAGDVYGAGSPTGIVFYENGALPASYNGLLLSCEPSLNKLLGYLPKPFDSGFELKNFTFFTSNPKDEFFGTDTTRGQKGFGDSITYFRPSDVAVGPDGAIYVADWFDPQVGGHGARDVLASGTIYRIAPKGAKLSVPQFDLNTTAGQIAALKSPAVNVRNLGFLKLKEQGDPALADVRTVLKDENPYIAVRAIWLMSQLGPGGKAEVEAILKHADPQFRIAAFRALRHQNHNTLKHAAVLAKDSSPAVRREVALAMRDVPLKECKEILLDIAEQFDGKDRWYVEALGLGSAKKEEAMWDAIQDRIGKPALEWDSRFHRITWRLHPPQAVPQLKLRLMTASLPIEERMLSMTALAFTNTESAANAMVDVALQGPEDLRTNALYWVKHRDGNDWRPYKVAARLGEMKSVGSVKISSIIVEKTGKPLPAIEDIARMKGDATRGEGLFHGDLAKCATCHRVGDKGKDIGPDLTAAAKKFSAPILLDSILNPSSAISFGFEGSQILTKEDQVYEGIVMGEGKTILIKDVAGEIHVVEAKDIAARKKMSVSIMPEFKGALSAQELADIIAFLQSQK
ncbi:MAG: NPCBM/NEW2 domain-containing protein [Planctomycetota bacterium]|nr:NPCBM/NEW2 domain-containing protein [Planctomycetota bacterium]MDA1137411.1 NPCBM/NEW2 domain-containing protein [Planctomycetota bacterium]